MLRFLSLVTWASYTQLYSPQLILNCDLSLEEGPCPWFGAPGKEESCRKGLCPARENNLQEESRPSLKRDCWMVSWRAEQSL